MKASKKSKKRQHQEAGAGTGDGAPRRVDPNAPISVRAQIKYVRVRKTIESTHSSSKNKVPNAFRRAKSTDYDDIVEPEDLSHVYMPKIDPSLLVDGYNIIYEWQKTSMMAVQGDFESARNLLLDELGAVAAMRGWTVTVVFDGHKRQGANRRKRVNSLNQVKAIFTGANESADMYIERHTMELKDSGCPSVMVATGDRLMQNLVSTAGAEIFSADRMIEEIQVCKQEAMSLTQSYINRKQKIIEAEETSELMGTAFKHGTKSKSKAYRNGNVGRGAGNSGKSPRDLDLEEMFG